jgi:hypothetical protein
MRQQREEALLARLIAAFPQMEDGDQRAIVGYAEASVRESPRPPERPTLRLVASRAKEGVFHGS